jgi:hypothetical protein
MLVWALFSSIQLMKVHTQLRRTAELLEQTNLQLQGVAHQLGSASTFGRSGLTADVAAIRQDVADIRADSRWMRLMR